MVALPERSWPSVVIATRQPLLIPPMMLKTGAREPSKNSWPNSAAPEIIRSGRFSTPFSAVNGSST